MTQISWQYQVNNRAGGYIVTNTDWNDVAGDLRAFIDQTTGSGTTDNSPLPIGIDLVNDRVYISDPDSTTPEDGNHADTTLSVVGTTTLAGNTQQTGTFTVGVDDTGFDVIFYGAATGAYMKWNQTTDDLQLVGAAGLDVAGDIDVDGTANLDVVDIDGTVQIDGTVTIGAYDLVVDTNCLYVDVSENRVGINTASPVLTGLTIGRQPSDANEGGQVNWEGGTSYSNNLSWDRYGNDLRLLYNGSQTGTWSGAGAITATAATISGNLSLGTTAAGETLNIAGVTTASGAGSNFVVKGGDATGTNLNGGYLIIKSGMGTGSGISGDVMIQCGPAGSSGTAQNTPTTRLTCTADGRVLIGGVLSKTSGTFDIPHPTRGGDWRLRHSFIEGPQADLIYRGTVTLSGGTATVDLDTASNMTDGTWEALCRDPWTMVASSGNAVEWSLSGKTLTITSDTADAVCSWMVIAERQDDHMKSPEGSLADDDGHLIVEYEFEEPVYGTPDEAAA